jgi:F-type H+-transporting ATPase subunit epsilon
MAETIQLAVATPEREIVREEVAAAQIPAKNGYLGVLPGHAPLLAELGTGVLSYTVGTHQRHLSVAGGFVEVLPDQVRVLATVAELAEDIDVERAKRALERSQRESAEAALGVDPAVALAAIARAEARLAAAEKNK